MELSRTLLSGKRIFPHNVRTVCFCTSLSHFGNKLLSDVDFPVKSHTFCKSLDWFFLSVNLYMFLTDARPIAQRWDLRTHRPKYFQIRFDELRKNRFRLSTLLVASRTTLSILSYVVTAFFRLRPLYFNLCSSVFKRVYFSIIWQQNYENNRNIYQSWPHSYAI